MDSSAFQRDWNQAPQERDKKQLPSNKNKEIFGLPVESIVRGRQDFVRQPKDLCRKS